MRKRIIGVSLVAVVMVSSKVGAQQPVGAPVPIQFQPMLAPVAFQPAIANVKRAPMLSDLVLAKVDMHEDGPRVIMMIESYRTEKKRVFVTRMVQETRERTVEFGGKKKVQTYTVNVPVSEEREVNTSVPAGRKPKTIDATEFRFYDLDAKEISMDEVAEKLSSLRPIFLIDQNSNQPQPLPEISQRAMKEYCVIAVTEKKIRHYTVVGANMWGAPIPPPIIPGQAFAPAVPNVVPVAVPAVPQLVPAIRQAVPARPLVPKPDPPQPVGEAE